MKRLTRALHSAIGICGLVTSAAFAQGFEGTWALDISRSVALPPGMSQQMTATRDGESLNVRTVIATDFADRTQDDRYVFDGAEHALETPGMGRGTRTAKRDGERAFRSSDRTKGPNGETTIERTWRLSDDGAELTIDLVAAGPAGRTETHRVFTRGERAAAASSAPAPSRLFPVDLSVAIAPTPFRQEGKVQLVYELALRNFRAGDVEWRRLEVLGDDGRRLATYEGDELQSILSRPGTLPGPGSPRRVGAGMTAVAFLWLAVDGAAPRALQHRAVFAIPAAPSGSTRIVETPLVAVGAPAVVIGPPVRGKGWVVRWISNASFHRRGLFAVDGRAQIGQRFAIDWNRFDDRGVEQSGDSSDNATYSVFGQDVIAVADGTIAWARDGMPPNTPPNVAPSVGTDPDNALGNSVVVELPGGLFATYAHLQANSLQVKVGDRVRRGQLLGRVGNSGNATGPHLHFHVATGIGLHGEGVPYVFDTFERLGAEDVTGAAPTWSPAGAKPATVRGELPPEHAVVAWG